MVIALLTIHNLLRWLVLLFAVLALVRAWSGWLGRKPWTGADDKAGSIFVMVLDLQVLLGLILYFYPGTYTYTAFGDMGSAMQNAAVRFYAIEHLLMMLVAVILAHVGRSASKRADDPRARFRRMATWFTASALIILAAIPWPFFPDYGRPLLRFFGLLN